MITDLSYENFWEALLDLQKKEQTKSKKGHNTTNLSPIISELLEKPSFSSAVDNALEKVVEGYFEKLPDNFSETLQQSADVIKRELILQLYVFLSSFTSEEIESVDEFWKTMDPVLKSSGYTSKHAFCRSLDYLCPPEKRALPIIWVNTEKETIKEDWATKYESRSCIEGTPLFDFIYSHLQAIPATDDAEPNKSTRIVTKPDHEKSSSIRVEEFPVSYFLEKFAHNNSSFDPAHLTDSYESTEQVDSRDADSAALDYVEENAIFSREKYRFHFNKEGWYFLYILIKTIRSTQTPYTYKGQSRLNYASFNNMVDALRSAYGPLRDSDADRNHVIERIQYVMGAENVFQLSFVEAIFPSFQTFFERSKADYSSEPEIFNEASLTWYYTFSLSDLGMLLGFKNALYLIAGLKNCPLNTAKIAAWSYYADKYFDSGAEYRKFRNINIPLFDEDAEKMADEIAEITDATDNLLLNFFYVIISYWLAENGGDPAQSMKDLKQELLGYIEGTDYRRFLKWSVLENRNDTGYPIIGRLPHDFFEHTLVSLLYLPDSISSQQYIENLYAGEGIQQYLRYIVRSSNVFKKANSKE